MQHARRPWAMVQFLFHQTDSAFHSLYLPCREVSGSVKYELRSTSCFSEDKCHSQREIHGHKLLCLGDFYVAVKFRIGRKKAHLISQSYYGIFSVEADSLCTALKCFDSSGKSSGNPESRACQRDAYHSLPAPPRVSRELPALAPGQAQPPRCPRGPAAQRPVMNQACPPVTMQENGMMNSFPSPHCP